MCSSGNSPKFWYVDNDGNLVHEKNKAAILFNSEFNYIVSLVYVLWVCAWCVACIVSTYFKGETFSTSFLVSCQRTELRSSNWHYAIDKSR